jgi:anti-anti-sigma factor
VGDLDLAAAPKLERRLAHLSAGQAPEIVIDLRLSTFMDCAGLSALLQADADSRRASWKLTIIPGPSAVRRVFEMTGTLETLPFIDSDDDAPPELPGPRWEPAHITGKPARR